MKDFFSQNKSFEIKKFLHWHKRIFFMKEISHFLPYLIFKNKHGLWKSSRRLSHILVLRMHKLYYDIVLCVLPFCNSWTKINLFVNSVGKAKIFTTFWIWPNVLFSHTHLFAILEQKSIHSSMSRQGISEKNSCISVELFCLRKTH